MKKKPLFSFFEGFKQSSSERRVVFLLSIIVIGLSIFPFIYDYFFVSPPQLIVKNHPVNQLKERTSNSKLENSRDHSSYNTLLNQAGYQDLTTAGLAPRKAKQLLAFRKSIGGFKNWNQVFKTYALNKDDKQFLRANFQLEEETDSTLEVADSMKNTQAEFDSNKDDTDNEPILVDANRGSIEDLKRIPGIGPYYAKRIIQYRNALGGFHSKEQLLETYGIPDSVKKNLIKYIIIKEAYSMIQVNEWSVEELSKHPYISYKQAKRIVAYRTQHQGIKSIDELMKAALLDENILEKLQPYIEF